MHTMSKNKHTRPYKNPTVRKCPKRACDGYMATVIARYFPGGPTSEEWECIECGLVFSKNKKKFPRADRKSK